MITAAPRMSTRNIPSPADAAAAPQQYVEFLAGSYEHQETNLLARPLVTTGENGIRVPINAYGFLRGLFVTFRCVTAGNAAAVAFVADAPFNLASQLGITDISGANLFGPLTGYQAYLASKWGAYGSRNPTLMPEYFTTTGGVATGGSFAFTVYVPVEAVKRTAFCALANRSNAARFNTVLSAAAVSAVYSVAPTTLAAASVSVVGSYWSDPAPADPSGRPIQPAPDFNGSSQFWSVDVQNAIASAGRQHALNRVGNLVRTVCLVQRDNTGARVPFTGTFRMTWDGRVVHDTSIDAYNNEVRSITGEPIDTGVLVFPYTSDFGPLSGAERKSLYLPTTDGSRIDWTFSAPGVAGGTLEILTNDITMVG